MKILIVTQTVDQDHPVLGFFPRWVEEFARHYNHIEVIALSVGKHTLPPHVRVHSLGKETKKEHALVYAWRFFKLVWHLRREYNSVFVHMNPEYLLIAGDTWKLLKRRVVLWYTHGTVSLPLRLGALWANVIATASEESMRLRTSKKRVLGHGLDTAQFPLLAAPSGALRFLTVGRIARVKRLETLVSLFAHTPGTLSVIGTPLTADDQAYEEELKKMIHEKDLSDRVVFLGQKNREGIIEELGRTHLFLHASATGSLDKAPLEALVCGVPVVTANAEIAEMPGAFLLNQETLASVVAEKVWENTDLRAKAREYVSTHHSLPVLIRRLSEELGR